MFILGDLFARTGLRFHYTVHSALGTLDERKGKQLHLCSSVHQLASCRLSCYSLWPLPLCTIPCSVEQEGCAWGLNHHRDEYGLPLSHRGISIVSVALGCSIHANRGSAISVLLDLTFYAI